MVSAFKKVPFRFCGEKKGIDIRIFLGIHISQEPIGGFYVFTDADEALPHGAFRAQTVFFHVIFSLSMVLMVILYRFTIR